MIEWNARMTDRVKASKGATSQWRSQKFSTGGASICSISFCSAALPSRPYNQITSWHSPYQFKWREVRTPLTPLVWLRHCNFMRLVAVCPYAISNVLSEDTLLVLLSLILLRHVETEQWPSIIDQSVLYLCSSHSGILFTCMVAPF